MSHALVVGRVHQTAFAVKDAWIFSAASEAADYSFAHVRKETFKQIQRKYRASPPKCFQRIKGAGGERPCERLVYDTLPVTVEYQITSYGKTLRPLIGELHKWEQSTAHGLLHANNSSQQ